MAYDDISTDRIKGELDKPFYFVDSATGEIVERTYKETSRMTVAEIQGKIDFADHTETTASVEKAEQQAILDGHNA